MLPRYTFHKESKDDLKEFLKAAAESQKDNPDNCCLINTYLNELTSHPQQQTAADSKQSETPPETDDVILTQPQSEKELTTQDHFNCSTTAELIENIAENLRIDETYNCENDLTKLASSCNEAQLENFILQIQKELDVKGICNFGLALCSCEEATVNVVFVLFCKHILLPLLHSEKSADFQDMFNRVYKKFHRSINKGDIVKKLLQTSSGVFLENISKIDGELKSEIIRDLTVTCKQLEQIHVKVLDCLLDKNTHHSAIKEIIALLASQGETNDNATGKLIVSILQILGRNINQFEQPLRQIIAKHKSVWRAKLQKTFDLNYQCSQLSQSLIKH